MNPNNSWLYIGLFILGTVFQAGGFFYVMKMVAKKVEIFSAELTQARLDIAWLKGRATRNGGRK